MNITNIISLIGGVALFLFGMNLMGDGLKKVAGNRLETILNKLTSSSIKGILLGTGVTAVIQSSSATSVMVVGFVNSGMMKTKQAIGVIMGAIIGTSITGWVIYLSSLDGGGNGIFQLLSTNTLTTVLAVAGVILLMFTKKEKNHNIAIVFLGFAVLMFGISAMTDAVYPLRESPQFIHMLTTFSNPIIGVLVGLIFTSIIQSASAAVGILQALAVTGAISFQLSLPIIMGVAIGASVPVLLSAIGANANGKRTALIYLLVDTFGVVLFSIIFYTINAFVHFNFMDMTMDMMSIALLNTVFRIVIVILLTPFIGLLEKLVCALIKDKTVQDEELEDVNKLDERFLPVPAVSIDLAQITINTMAKVSRKNLFVALELFDSFSEKCFDKALRLEKIIDTYEDKLGKYLVKIMKGELDEEQNKTVSMFFHAINDYERISDHSKNLAEAANEIAEKKIRFSTDAEKEMKNFINAVIEMVDLTVTAFTKDNIEMAHRIAPLEKIINNLCDECKIRHIERIRNGECEYEHGFVWNDMLTDLERIGDHCSNIGIAMRINHNEISDMHSKVSRTEIKSEYDFDKIYQEYIEKYRVVKDTSV